MENYGYVKTKRDFVAKQYAKKGASSWFKKLGNSLVAVVVVLPVAGLFAAIGGIVMSKGTNEASYTVGLILSDLGQTVLSNLGLLFMFAILLGFTNTKGYALFAAAIGYIAFIGFITPFIRYNGNPSDATTFNIWFWKNLQVKTQLANVFGLGQQALSTNALLNAKHGEFARLSYEGFTTLNTGVLGGIVLGFVFTWVYNHGKNLKLPNMFSFFSGEKFSSVVSLCLTPIIASLFIIIWPGVNWVLGEIGIGLTKLPYALDAFVFGIVKQLLIPFEAHQAVIAPLWYTQAGGSLSQSQADVIASMMYRLSGYGSAGIGQEGDFINRVQTWAEGIKGTGDQSLWSWIGNNFTGETFDKATIVKMIDDFSNVFGSNTNVQFKSALGDIKTSLSDYAAINWKISGDQLMTMEVLNNHPEININDFWSSNLKITRFITGGYANLMFLTPAVGFAMWSTLSKDARKRKMGFYVGAILPSFILGVNEPVIFMFAYTAPIIYYVAYSGICGVLFLFTSLFQAKLSSTFSQGLVDYVVNGVIPTVTRNDGVSQTKLWIPLVIGVITFVFGFIIFRWLFIQLEFVAPGMEEVYDSDEKGKSVYSTTKPVVSGFLEYFTNAKNIKSIQWQNGVLVINLKDTFEYKKNDFADHYFKKISVDKNNNVYIQPNDKDKYDFVRAINYVQAIVDLQNIKHKKLTADQKVQQRINKVEAKWQIKHDSLDTTTDVEKATEKYKEELWALIDSEQRELLKVKGQEVQPIDEQTKQKVKQLTKDYKQQVKQLKLANKQKIKAERGLKSKKK